MTTPTPRSARTAPVRPLLPSASEASPWTMPAFWVVTLLMATGAVRVGLVLGEAGHRYPRATAAAIVMFALYAVPFWSFLAGLDYLEREPPALMATAFTWGALVATTVSMSGGVAAHNILAKLTSPAFAADWGPALAGSTVEEIAKALGVAMIVLLARGEVNSVLDGFVYGAMVGLGFQVVEDMIFAVGAVAVAGQGDQLDPVVTTFLLRGFLAGLWSHTVFTGLAGAGVGYLLVRVERPRRVRIGALVLALAAGWLCHFLWNSPIWADGLGHGAIGVLAVLVLKGTPSLIMITLVVWAAHGREADYYLAQLDQLGDPRAITPVELRVLASGRLRAQARRYAATVAGHRGARTVRRLQTAQARLAVALSRATVAGSDDDAIDALISHWHREVHTQRDRLAELGHPEATVGAGRPSRLRRYAGAAVGLTVLLAIAYAINRLAAG